MSPLHKAEMIVTAVGIWMVLSSIMIAALVSMNYRQRDRLKRLDKIVADHLALDPRYIQEGYADDE